LNKQLQQGMNDRVYCGGNTTGPCDAAVNPPNGKPACPGNYNYWVTSNALSDVESQSPPDSRLLTLFITGFGDTHNGNNYVPIVGFAEFYVTGWAGDPCLPPPIGKGTTGQTTANGLTLNYTTDDVPPGDAQGILMGHFIKYIQFSPGSGSGQCTQNTFGNCIPVLTK
jgi:hypothetical protein